MSSPAVCCSPGSPLYQHFVSPPDPRFVCSMWVVIESAQVFAWNGVSWQSMLQSSKKAVSSDCTLTITEFRALYLHNDIFELGFEAFHACKRICYITLLQWGLYEVSWRRDWFDSRLHTAHLPAHTLMISQVLNWDPKSWSKWTHLNQRPKFHRGAVFLLSFFDAFFLRGSFLCFVTLNWIVPSMHVWLFRRALPLRAGVTKNCLRIVGDE